MPFIYDPSERIRTLRLARAVASKTNSDIQMLHDINPTMLSEWDRDLRKWQTRLQRETTLLAQAAARLMAAHSDDQLDRAA